MKRNVAKKVARRKRRVLKRLERARECRFVRGLDSTTVIGANALTYYELSERVHAINHGGIGMMVKLARDIELVILPAAWFEGLFTYRPARPNTSF